jgi:general secretion pathway protein G
MAQRHRVQQSLFCVWQRLAKTLALQTTINGRSRAVGHDEMMSDLALLGSQGPCLVAGHIEPPVVDMPLWAALSAISSVRRRYEFYLWAQTQLHAALPHGLLICGLPRAQTSRMVFDYFYSVPIDPEAIARLCDPRDGLLPRLTERWVNEGFEPLLITRSVVPQIVDVAAQELQALGFGAAVVHGVARAQGSSGANGIFAFVSVDDASVARACDWARLLVPPMFAAYSRALTRERPQEMTDMEQLLSEPDTSITEREVEILRWVRDGKSNLEIGMILSISPLTVKNHVQKILRKLNASNRAQAVSKAISLKLLTASGGRSNRAVDEGGFTLLEILVVLVIIGLLAGVVAPKFFNQVGKSEVRVAKTQLDSLGKALDQYRLDIGRYPSTTQGLVALTQKPDDEPKWAGPYLTKEAPTDPWGRPYGYRSPAGNAEVELLSLGKDGQPGGQGDAEDVSLVR